MSMRRIHLGLVLFICGLQNFCYGADKKSRESIYGAFSRDEALSWDELQVVAQDSGIGTQTLEEMRIRSLIQRLITRYNLPLEFHGFSPDIDRDEEFRLSKGSRPGVGSFELSSDMSKKSPPISGNVPYLTYLLFRAQAYYVYRSRYDPEHCTWIVREESESMETSFRILRQELNNSALSDDIKGPPTDRDMEFRKTLDPSQDQAKTLQKLVEFALKCIAQKAADNWALSTFREKVGEPPLDVQKRVQDRERSLASDFGRARFAMTTAERTTFHRILKTPFRYAESQTP